MENGKPQSLAEDQGSSERLDSWKEIASYLKRDERTVRRWEKEGLPVHRHVHARKATVYAYKSEVDRWWRDGCDRVEVTKVPDQPPRRRTVVWSAALTLLIVLLASSVYGLRDRLTSSPTARGFKIAVLPFKDLSGDPPQDLFADGMTEALITELGKIGALDVTSHQSVIRYRQTSKTIPEIARELNVDALLEGTVLYSRGRVRITANLVQAVPERHLWADSYDFDPQDVLKIQGAVARDVASRVRIKVSPQEQARLTHSRRIDPDVYAAYLLGRGYLRQPPTPDTWKKAKECFDKAIAGDHVFAPAYASLAELHMRARGSPFKTPADLRRQARQYAELALRLDETLAEAHTALARASQQEWDWVTAEREYRRAIEVNPSYAPAQIWYAMFLYGMGRFDAAIVQARDAQRHDPASPYVNTWAAAAYLYGGNNDEGNKSLQTALDMDPRYTDANIIRARAMVGRGRYDEAVSELQAALTRTSRREPLVLGALAHAQARAGRRREALELVNELQRIEADAGQQYVPPFGLIWAYAGLGDNDHAIRGLKQAFDAGSDRIIWLNVDQFLDPLRSDSRFVELVHRVGLPANSLRAQ